MRTNKLELSKFFNAGLKALPREKHEEFYALLIEQTPLTSFSSRSEAAVYEKMPMPVVEDSLSLDLRLAQFTFEHGHTDLEAGHQFASIAHQRFTAHGDEIQSLKLMLPSDCGHGEISRLLDSNQRFVATIARAVVFAQPQQQLELLTSSQELMQTVNEVANSELPQEATRNLFSQLDEIFLEGFRNHNRMVEIRDQLNHLAKSDHDEERQSLEKNYQQLERHEQTRQITVNRTVGTIGDGFSLFSMLANLSGNRQTREFGHQIEVVGKAACTIISTLSSYAVIAAVSGPLAPIVGIVGAVFSIFSLFSTGPDPLEVISRQIVALAEQVNDFRNEIMGHLDEVALFLEKKIMALGTALSTQMDTSFNRIEKLLETMDRLALERFTHLREGVSLLQKTADLMREDLKKILESQEENFTTLYTQPFLEKASAAIFFHTRVSHENRTRGITSVTDDYHLFLLWLTNNTKNPLLTGESETISLPEILQRRTVEYAISPLVKAAEPFLKRSYNLPNPTIYLQVVWMFAQFIRNTPEVLRYDIFRFEDIERIFKIGCEIEDFIMGLRTHPDLFKHLIKNYRQSITAVNEQILSLIYNFDQKPIQIVTDASPFAIANFIKQNLGTRIQILSKQLHDNISAFAQQWYSQSAYPAGLKTYELCRQADVWPGDSRLHKAEGLIDASGRAGDLLQRTAERFDDHFYSWDNYLAVNQIIEPWNQIASLISKLRALSLETEKSAENIKSECEKLSQFIAQIYKDVHGTYQRAINIGSSADLSSIEAAYTQLQKEICQLESQIKDLLGRVAHVYENLALPAGRFSFDLIELAGVNPEGTNIGWHKSNYATSFHSTRGRLGKQLIENAKAVMDLYERNNRSVNEFIDFWNSLAALIQETRPVCLQAEVNALALRARLEMAQTEITAIKPILQELIDRNRTAIRIQKVKEALVKQGYTVKNPTEEYVVCYLTGERRQVLNEQVRQRRDGNADFRSALQATNDAFHVLKSYVNLAFRREFLEDTELQSILSLLWGANQFNAYIDHYRSDNLTNFVYYVIQDQLLGNLLPCYLQPWLEKNIKQAQSFDRAGLAFPRASGYPLTHKAFVVLLQLSSLYFPEQSLFPTENLDLALQLAAIHGNQTALSDLLEYGANPNTQHALPEEVAPNENENDRTEGRTTLMWLVVTAQRPDLVAFVLTAGAADPTIANNWGWTAVHQAAGMVFHSDQALPIMRILLADTRSTPTLFKPHLGGETPLDVVKRLKPEAKKQGREKQADDMILMLEEAQQHEASQYRAQV